MKQNEQWTQYDIDVENTPDTSPLDWDEQASTVPVDDDFINDEYCWMHTPGGWSCPECRQASK